MLALTEREVAILTKAADALYSIANRANFPMTARHFEKLAASLEQTIWDYEDHDDGEEEEEEEEDDAAIAMRGSVGENWW